MIDSQRQISPAVSNIGSFLLDVDAAVRKQEPIHIGFAFHIDKVVATHLGTSSTPSSSVPKPACTSVSHDRALGLQRLDEMSVENRQAAFINHTVATTEGDRLPVGCGYWDRKQHGTHGNQRLLTDVVRRAYAPAGYTSLEAGKCTPNDAQGLLYRTPARRFL